MRRIFAVMTLLASLCVVSTTPQAQGHRHNQTAPTTSTDAVCTPETTDGKQPGDYGYCHTPAMHKVYAEVFKRCPCHVGECRVTKTRPSDLSQVGYEVLANGTWVPVTEAMLVHDVTKEQGLLLDQFPAHICVYKGVDCVYLRRQV